MATVQCPNCGAINPNGKRLLARCQQCNVYMAACRYCQFYDRRMMDCTHPARPEELRITDPSESLNCADFTALGRGRSLKRVLRTASIAIVVTLAALFGGIRIYEAATTAPPEVLLHTIINTTSQLNLGEGTFDVKAFVRNDSEHTAKDVQVFISGPSMPDLVCEWTDPPEAYAEGPGRSISGWIGDLDPGQVGSVFFYFQAKEATQIKLTAQVTSANVAGPQRIVLAGEVLP
ncbi:MAG: hypothetical protein JXA57_00715 [Armatimonadetes bacterium]|nr:hypothetical protein [Armatimonadota bacterium]